MATLTLINKEHLVDNVWAFRFQPSQALTWTPGQYIRVELPHDAPDEEGTKRWFTISSAPFEGIVQITTRVTNSTFKQALAAKQEGDEIALIEEPEGDFVMGDEAKPVVWIAGGIGVTPFYSIAKQRAHDATPIAATLLYGSRDENIPFKDEFNNWAAVDTSFTVEYVTGVPLTVEKLTELHPDLNDSIVYLSGPEPMVETLGDQLKEHGLPSDQLKQDYFPNYTEANY